MITISARTTGPLYREQIRISLPGRTDEITAIVIANDPASATVVDKTGRFMDSGRLEYGPTTERGRETRTLYFVPSDNRARFAILSERLTVNMTPIAA